MSSSHPGGRPFIHLNFACAADGTMAAAEGPLPISSAADWRRVHGLRERYDGVAIGARTWERDRPLLTVRRERLGRDPRRQPCRVIFGGSRPCAVAPDGRRTFLVGAGAPAEGPNGGPVLIPAEGHHLGGPLGALFRHGVRSLLVEGGAMLLRSFLDQGFCDRLTVFVPAARADRAMEAVAKVLAAPPPLAGRRFGEGVLLEWVRREEAADRGVVEVTQGLERSWG